VPDFGAVLLADRVEHFGSSRESPGAAADMTGVKPPSAGIRPPHEMDIRAGSVQTLRHGIAR
jgi:hypothetical protein